MTLIDGSYHNVDSDEHSFRAAGRKAFRAAIEKVKPVLLEPIMDVEITAPLEYSGDIMGDSELAPGPECRAWKRTASQQVVKAQVPMSEMLNYQSILNSNHRCPRLVSTCSFRTTIRFPDSWRRRSSNSREPKEELEAKRKNRSESN